MSHFFSELKHRKVVRVGMVYAASAFVVLQAVDIILPRLGVPDWAMSLIVMLTVAGFPIALVMGWVLEWTPEGVKRTSRRDAAEIVTPPSLLGKQTLFASALLVMLGIGLGAGWFLSPGTSGPSPVAGDEPVRSTASGTSIAVLAFANMSPDPDNAFFAQGISEEILNVLASITGLRVASRTSAFSFGDSRVPIPEIARQLNVAHVLEGSVRRVGPDVRITAQLIDAVEDVPLWSQAFSRQLEDVFAIQEEIAQSIVDALEQTLGVTRVNLDAPTRDLVAYELFLRGRELFHQRSEFLTAIADLRSAVARDPDFAEAWVYLAATCVVITSYSESALSAEDAEACARDSVTRALALRPDQPLALSIWGGLQPPERALAGLETRQRAAALAQHDSTPILWFGIDLLLLGYVDEAVETLERAYRIDPLRPINNGWLAIAYLAAGRDSLALPRMAFAARHGWGVAEQVYLTHLAFGGQRDQAADLISANADPAASAAFDALARAVREPDQLEGLLQTELLDAASSAVLGGAESWLLFGQLDGFFETLLNSSDEERMDFQRWAMRSVWLPPMGALRNDPRLLQLADALGYTSIWEQRGYPPGCQRMIEQPPRLAC